MTIPFFKSKPEINVLSVAVYCLAIFGVLSLVYFGGSIIKNKGNIKGKSALSVDVVGGNAQIYLNDNFLGNAPFESKDINAGENKLSIKNDNVTYNVALDFLPNSEVAIMRDLGVSDVFSSGQNFWLEKADGAPSLALISEPTGAKVLIDNTEVGVTPYSTSTLSEGEYDLRVEKAGFDSMSSRIKIQKGFKLNIAVKLFPSPVPAKVSLLEGSQNLYDVYSTESLVTSSPAEWVKAILYWNTTRGINLSGTGVNKDLVFDYFIDCNGRVYNKDGQDVTDAKQELKADRGAYLRRVSDGPGLTESAKNSLQSLSLLGGKKAKINQTGTGWLNVRSTPGLTGSVLTTVNVGESYQVLEESKGWVKIKVTETVSGWVSTSYITLEL
uniref:PEGA domain-containing protein n=1 Tax=candidate division WWE3 bacterium TaxID=2053526 RepID=A0A7C4TK85_UNCKA